MHAAHTLIYSRLIERQPRRQGLSKELIDNLVVKVFVDDGYATVHIKLGNATEVADIRLKEVKKALEHLFNSVQTQSPLAQRKGFEPLDTFLHHTISNRARSTAPPSLQNACIFYNKYGGNATLLYALR